MSCNDEAMAIADEREQEVRELFEDGGWRVQSPPSDEMGFDLIASKGSDRYAIEIKSSREPSRRAHLEGLLASAILRSRAAARLNLKPLAIVHVRAISDGLLRELEEFVDRFGEGAGWGVMDESGLAVFHAPGLENLRRERREVRKAPALAPHSDFLSDLGQWMLKVLISHRLPPEFRFVAPEQGRVDRPISNALQLSRVADVSSASAARFVAALKDERFVVDGGALRLIREKELLDRWRAAQPKRPREVRARWLFPQKDPVRHLEDLVRKHAQESGPRACLGLFAACDRHGFRFVSGVAPHMYLEGLSVEHLQPFGLRFADPGESADVFVREPRYPKSVFRGCAKRDGVPVSDVLQCWLDVADHPARGEEMAAHLFERVIQPSLLERD
jgi:hypothetical protein